MSSTNCTQVKGELKFALLFRFELTRQSISVGLKEFVSNFLNTSKRFQKYLLRHVRSNEIQFISLVSFVGLFPQKGSVASIIEQQRKSWKSVFSSRQTVAFQQLHTKVISRSSDLTSALRTPIAISLLLFVFVFNKGWERNSTYRGCLITLPRSSTRLTNFFAYEFSYTRGRVQQTALRLRGGVK